MLQRHSDIKVTDAADTNHIAILGKFIAATPSHCKTESNADWWNQTPGIHNTRYCIVGIVIGIVGIAKLKARQIGGIKLLDIRNTR